MELISHGDKLRDYLQSLGNRSIFVFILLQVVQVVIVIIPGEAVQIAGGFVYGTFMGTVYSLAGIFIGSVIAFFLVKFVGYPVLKLFVPKRQLEKFNFLFSSPKADIILFILFLIPGLPKDILTYIAGLTPVRNLKFFAIIMTARLPGIFISSIIGQHMYSGNYLVVIIVSAVAVLLFLAGWLFKDKIIGTVAASRNNS